MDVQVARTKVKELKAEAKHLQRALRQVESDLALILKRKKETERRTEECIQGAKHSSIEKFKASPTFAEEMARAIEAFKASKEYRDSHVTFSEKNFHQAHKEDQIDYRKLIEKHPKLDFIFLDYEDGDEDGEKVHTISELPTSEKENVVKPLSSSTADAGPSEPPSDTPPQEKVGD